MLSRSLQGQQPAASRRILPWTSSWQRRGKPSVGFRATDKVGHRAAMGRGRVKREEEIWGPLTLGEVEESIPVDPGSIWSVVAPPNKGRAVFTRTRPDALPSDIRSVGRRSRPFSAALTTGVLGMKGCFGTRRTGVPTRARLQLSRLTAWSGHRRYGCNDLSANRAKRR